MVVKLKYYDAMYSSICRPTLRICLLDFHCLKCNISLSSATCSDIQVRAYRCGLMLIFMSFCLCLRDSGILAISFTFVSKYSHLLPFDKSRILIWALVIDCHLPNQPFGTSLCSSSGLCETCAQDGITCKSS